MTNILVNIKFIGNNRIRMFNYSADAALLAGIS